jgi:hypothetical protein
LRGVERLGLDALEDLRVELQFLSLVQEQATGRVHATGRDIDETEWALHFHAAAGAWQLLEGPAQEHTLPETRAEVLRYLRTAGVACGPKAIAEGTGLAYELIKKTCQRMNTDGQISTDPAGRYMAMHSDQRVPSVPVIPMRPLTSEKDGDSDLISVSPVSRPLTDHLTFNAEDSRR